jgi:hypothetical protein
MTTRERFYESKKSGHQIEMGDHLDYLELKEKWERQVEYIKRTAMPKSDDRIKTEAKL